MQSALASALVVDEPGLTLAQHHVARLKIAVHEILVRRSQQETRQAAEVIFQRLLIERHSRQAQKIIFEVIQIPGDGLPVEAARADSRPCNSNRARLPPGSAAARPPPGDMPPRPRCAMLHPRAMRAEKVEQRGVAQVFFEIRALLQIFGVNLRHRQSMAAEMPGKLQEGDVSLRAPRSTTPMALTVRRPASRTMLRPEAPKLPLQGLHLLGRRAKMLLEKLLQDIHEIDARAILHPLAPR